MVEENNIHHFNSTPKRIKWIGSILATFAIILGVGLVYTQIFYGPEGATQAKLARSADIEIPANRGSIYDANNNLMAVSIDRYVIAVDQIVAKQWKAIDCDENSKDYCHQIGGKPVGANGVIGLSRILSSVLGRPAQEIAYNLLGDSNYKIIAKDVTPEVARALVATNIGGVINLKQTSSRVYPNGNIAGSEVGVANTAADGQITAQAGIELMMDEQLAGKPGKRAYERGGNGERIPMTNLDETPAENGHDVKSSIDMDIQWKLQQVLDTEKGAHNPTWAIGMVERIKTGEIVAIAGDNEPTAGSQEIAEHGSKAFGTQFEPGSVVKVLTTSGLIDAGLQQPESQFQVPDHIKTAFGQEIKDASNHGVERLTLAGIVGFSYNTGTTLASVNWPLDQRYNKYSAYGLGKLSSVGFPGETPGMLKYWGEEEGCDGSWSCSGWDDRQRDTVLFGQGMAVSALQITNAFATIANGGKNPLPTLISATKDNEDKWQPYPKTDEALQVIVPETAQKVQGILETAVENGAIKSAKIPEIRVGGKTGTAEMAGANGQLTSIVGDFIGVFPMDDPQYTVSIFLLDSQVKYPTQQAISMFKDVAQFVIQKFGITASAPATYLPPVRW